MNEASIITDLEQPWQRDRLLEVRTGKAKPVFGLSVQSAILKSVRYGPVPVSKLGCRGDEHAYEFHGGLDKALLQYCSRHYDTWSQELPRSAHLFRLGGFGENMVAQKANERNTCIGDIIRIGRDVIAQEGSIRAGDEIVLVERPHPLWNIARVQHYLYIEKENMDMMRQLADLDSLGMEIRNIFENRLRKKFENQEQRLLGDSVMTLNMWTDYRLIQKENETPTVTSFVFEALDMRDSPQKVQPGTHVRLKLGGRLIRAYSVVEGNQNRFTLGVALNPQTSRGGSLYLHRALKEGDTITISEFSATFPLATEADRHVLIAGGIGITGLLASARELQQGCQRYHLHYIIRSAKEVAFKSLLDELSPNVTIYTKEKDRLFDVSKVLQNTDRSAHIYCCSGERLMNAVRNTAKNFGFSERNVHFESFQAGSTGDPFTAELAESKKGVEVVGGESLLNALRSAGFDIPSTCEAGNCGTCRVGVRKGRIEHRGTGLLENEKDTAMLSCVSRGIGHIVLDL
ncbi:uncharacterized protein N7503_012128 [Penicillium pulvis]|uniref:uncharacterized protein n=1 Tax=Penicillium pulvis TaxID=1562058 RepID=UPI0025474530|nr:uncharacterized protein N7503_012128 [Penicillium pulvis]KAJ5786916.1 hypothetical protein N7503_012128 [Penicillium pulvis]